MALTVAIYGTYGSYLWHLRFYLWHLRFCLWYLRCLTMALVILTDYFVTDDTCDTYFYIIYIYSNIIYINIMLSCLRAYKDL